MDTRFLRPQIEALRLRFPDLADDEELWDITLESETDLHQVFGAIENKRQNDLAMSAAIDRRIEQLETRQRRIDRRVEAMRSLAYGIMSYAEIKKIEIPEATFSIRAGTPKVIITDENAIPDSACRIRREPDRIIIKEMLKEGPVAGAILSNAEPVLSIKTS